MSYREDRTFTDQYTPAIKGIVGPLLLEPAPLEEDAFRATDLMILKARDLRIGCRMRRDGFKDRFPFDFTIRSKRDNGTETEMRKFVNGFGDWFFYGHAAKEGISIDRWMVVDLAAWRAHLILKGWQYFVAGKTGSNNDGTHFMAFDARKFQGPPKLFIATSFPLFN